MPRSSPVRPDFSLLRFVAITVLAVTAFCLTPIQRSIQQSGARTQTAQPHIAVAGWTLTAESCTMPDGLIEPGEPVTLSIALQNTGTASTSQQLVATLQASGGVTLPTGGPQNYGRLTAGGPSVERSFTFTAASQQLGSTITLMLQLSDSGVSRGTATTTITLGLLVLDADPSVCTTGFRTNSPSPCHLTHCVSSRRPPFPVGNYSVICDTDAPSRFTLLLTVQDTEQPRITCPVGVDTSAGSNRSAVITYPPVTATDNCQVNVTCVPPSGAAFPVGTTVVNCAATDSSNNTASCAFNVVVRRDVEIPLPPSVASSDQKAGSVLAFPVFTSSITSPQAQNTRLAITNIELSRQAFVHLFFISEACSVADSFVCLTAQQTMAFTASDFDPGTTGYVLAVATDSSGCPVNFNFLIGDEYVKFQTGHAANLGAQAFAALSAGPACMEATSATIKFDGISYSMAPRVIAADTLPSRTDGNDTLIVVNRIGGDLRAGANAIGTLTSLLYDDMENVQSYSLSAGCQYRGRFYCLGASCPSPRIEDFIPSGRSGWLRLYCQSDIAIFGSVINYNINTRNSANAYNQGHNLHPLTLTSTASITIPVMPPNC
ncbi:MAG: HYR domain-containing protein [Blastocatellia bacterium]